MVWLVTDQGFEIKGRNLTNIEEPCHLGHFWAQLSKNIWIKKWRQHLNMERASTSEPVRQCCRVYVILLHLGQGEVRIADWNSCHLVNFVSILWAVSCPCVVRTIYENRFSSCDLCTPHSKSRHHCQIGWGLVEKIYMNKCMWINLCQ